MKYKNLVVTFSDSEDSLSYNKTFKDAVMMVSGDHLIITEHTEDGLSITGKIFPLRNVDSYKAGKE